MSPTGSGYGTPPPTPTHHGSPPAATAEIQWTRPPRTPPRRGALAAPPLRHKPRRARWRSVPGGSSVLPLALRPPRSGRLRPPSCSMALRARSTAHRADDQESCRRSTVDRPDRCFHLNRWLLADPRRHLEADPTATLQYPTLKELSIIDRLKFMAFVLGCHQIAHPRLGFLLYSKQGTWHCISYHAEALARGIVLVGAELLMRRSSHLFCHCTNEHFPTYSVWLSDKGIRNCTFVLTKGSLMDTYGNINKLCAGSCS
ncbi:uncharacterized protein LOC120703547 isoform X2 [Panicum virgatum]|uniref:uncharacterized protein LOC120703547 isoform X2 n=1 Tax=Panicum virgatum TaxID=38727 RepID=UPI0019D629B1|nr:uncharacterized protein LOC120703547 isoform X2 [Panicum virgatum]